jgi:hypothetical protein
VSSVITTHSLHRYPHIAYCPTTRN